MSLLSFANYRKQQPKKPEPAEAPKLAYQGRGFNVLWISPIDPEVHSLRLIPTKEPNNAEYRISVWRLDGKKGNTHQIRIERIRPGILPHIKMMCVISAPLLPADSLVAEQPHSRAIAIANRIASYLASIRCYDGTVDDHIEQLDWQHLFKQVA